MTPDDRLDQLTAGHVRLMTEHELFVKEHEKFVAEQDRQWEREKERWKQRDFEYARDRQRERECAADLDTRIEKLVSGMGQFMRDRRA